MILGYLAVAGVGCLGIHAVYVGGSGEARGSVLGAGDGEAVAADAAVDCCWSYSCCRFHIKWPLLSAKIPPNAPVFG